MPAMADNLPAPAQDSDFRSHDDAIVELGKALFFDKELSGNRDASCATCHSPLIGTVDGLSMNIGTGGKGLGVLRSAGTTPVDIMEPQSRGARNTTPLFNLGHASLDVLFWDGRVQPDDSLPQGILTPAGENLPMGFENSLDALSIFAIADHQEMAGQPGTNELADALAKDDHIGVWDATVTRVAAISEYLDLMDAAFPGEINGDANNITIVHMGKAMGAYQAQTFRSDNSPFDQYLRGDKGAMSKNARAGMKLFYGDSGCSSCHAGVFQTDNLFYAIGVPQVGSGFGDGKDGIDDFGREGVTGDADDRYKFRTPSLRNIALLGPWGHNGFFDTLEGVVRHHLDPTAASNTPDAVRLIGPSRADLDAADMASYNDPDISAAVLASIQTDLLESPINDKEIGLIMDFLHALTDVDANITTNAVPTRVPSGLLLD